MKKIFLFAAATFALTACNNDNYVDEPVVAQVTASIENSAESRTSNNRWSAGDKIGITMGDKYVNMEYTTVAGNGTFTGATMYFNNKTDKVKFSAYYPFTGTSGVSPEPVTFSTTADKQTEAQQAAFDFLYATVSDVTGANPHVQFSFAHMMSKITLIFMNGNGADVSKIESYSIEGLALEGTFNTQSGVCAVNEDATAKTISMTPGNVQNNVALTSLIVFPQTTNGVKLKISDSEGQNYECKLNFEGNRLASGNNYQFTVTVNKSGLTVNESSITDWNTKPTNANADAV
ncbi:MAG: fimbrillin family protein [Muribaculaceae bacterium]|nr:fimbrillin family protein [Muribaculaceae bacterium]